MRTKSKIPKWALKFKTKGTEIRLINKKLYLYEITSKWDKEKKRPVKVTLGCIGRITHSGVKKSKRRKLQESLQHITNYEYGVSLWMYKYNEDIIKTLQRTFPDYWREIFIATYMRLVYQAPIKNYSFYYNISYLQEWFKNIGVSWRSMSSVFKGVGLERENVIKFFKKLHKRHPLTLLIDISHIFSFSRQLGINHKGYNNKYIFDPQINLLFIYSPDLQVPVYYRVLGGNISDVKTMKNAIKESGFSGSIIIISDKGFNSEDNRKLLEEDGLKYILPLKRDSSLIDYTNTFGINKENWDGFFMYNDRAIWYYSYKRDNRRIFVFLDELLRGNEEKDYLRRIEKKYEGYKVERYHQIQHRFGTIAIITNLEEKDGSKIYSWLKSRAEIEQMYDMFKNVLNADRFYLRDEYQLEGWMFINYLAMVYWYRLYQLLKKNELLKKYSPMDLIRLMREIKKIKIGKEWFMGEYPKKYGELLDKLGIPIV